MTTKIIILIALTAFTLTGCSAPSKKATAAPGEGWSVRFCEGTKEDDVRLEIGRGGDSGSHRYWKNVNPQAELNHIFPEDLRHAEEIWIKVIAVHEKEVQLCVKYDGANRQKMTFNEDEEHEVSKGDSDDCGC